MFRYYKNTLLSLFAQVKLIHTAPGDYQQLCLDVQETLIRKISYVERNIKYLRACTKDYKKQLGDADSPLSKDEALHIKQQISVNREKIQDYQYLLQIFREVGDAIAFSYISKWDIKPLSLKEPSGFLSGKKGARLERAILRKLFEFGQVAILADLTNCLRYSDVVVPKDGYIYFLEAKSTAIKNQRTMRQEKKIEAISKYLLTDQTDELLGIKAKVIRVNWKSEEVHHRDKLNAVIKKAFRDGTSYVEVEKGLFYIVAVKFDKSVIYEVANKCAGLPIAAIVNEYKRHRERPYLPFTLTLDDPETLFRFYSGEFTIAIVVDDSVIDEHLAKFGYFRDSTADKLWPMKIVNSKQGDDQLEFIEIRKSLLVRVFTEFLSLKWLLAEITKTQAPEFIAG
jgi:Holliday junction resolvase